MESAMNEELSFGPLPSHPRQDALLVKYLLDIEDRIRMATSEASARNIVVKTMESFGAECENRVLGLMLRQHLDRLVQRHWNKDTTSATIRGNTSEAEH
jgi:hypothetical protein